MGNLKDRMTQICEMRVTCLIYIGNRYSDDIDLPAWWKPPWEDVHMTQVVRMRIEGLE